MTGLVCLSVCVCVVLVGSIKKLWVDFNEIYRMYSCADIGQGRNDFRQCVDHKLDCGIADHCVTCCNIHSV